MGLDMAGDYGGDVTDAEVIRKAVEYAEGWQYESIDSENDHVLPPNCSICFPILDCDSFLADLLAAQLVRQVDRMRGYDFTSLDGHCDITTDQLKDCAGYWFTVADAEGPDRTMNTLRVIVQAAEDEDFRRKLTEGQ